MATRCLTVFKEKDGTEIAVLYRHQAGHPDGHGKELAEFLAGKSIVNGINDTTPDGAFNGMGCLAAQVVAHFKDGIGNFYLHPAGTRDVGEVCIYTVTERDGRPNIVTEEPA